MTQPVPERPGRYQRSTGGLVGAMLVTLLVVGLAATMCTVKHNDVGVKPEPVDYLAAVSALQEGGRRPVYPRSLPSGWIATSVHLGEDQASGWSLGALTGEGHFAGLVQSPEPVPDLVAKYVDKDAAEGQPVQLPGEVGPTWRTFTDQGGDTAYVTEVGQDSVMVYGSAPSAQLRELVASLTTDPV